MSLSKITHEKRLLSTMKRNLKHRSWLVPGTLDIKSGSATEESLKSTSHYTQDTLKASFIVFAECVIHLHFLSYN